MGQSWNSIVEQIQQLQLMDAADVEQLPKLQSSTQSASRGLTKLIKSRKITKYQARQLIDGRALRLRMGNYVILSPLGEGAMGRVLKARHVQMNRVVAIKTLTRETASRQISNKRFENEIRFVSQLTHPNIVQAYDAGVHNGIMFLVNEYIEGIDLQQLVSKSGPLLVPTALRYLTQAACALAYAHANKIIHRDVKPANLMINREGQIKLLDLGLARLFQNDDGESVDASLTDECVIVGTCAFMAPELAKSPKSFGPSTDIYSLGCTLFYLLNGKVPYSGKTYMETFLAHAQAPIPRLCSPDTPLAPALNEMFTKLIAKNPQNRFQNMAEVAAELKKLTELFQEQEGTSPSASIPVINNTTETQWTVTEESALETIGTPWYANGKIRLAAAAVILVGLGGGTYYMYSPQKSKHPGNSGKQTSAHHVPGGNQSTTDQQPSGNPAAPRAPVPRETKSKVFNIGGE